MKTITRKIVVPDWAKFIAQDFIGVWYAYEFSPSWDNEQGWIVPDGKSMALYEGPINKPSRKTLERLPCSGPT